MHEILMQLTWTARMAGRHVSVVREQEQRAQSCQPEC
jgi:hypothetical protein